ncbi:hypothetical protein KN400_3493 [Geobacter sulfurreducens KN400]|nr:hypothetical protein KN400_3493 [Geobacter sulfurreducens KN400]AJY68717.1 hypothetical protein RW64_03425 [Geobacter sulfurreducens]
MSRPVGTEKTIQQNASRHRLHCPLAHAPVRNAIRAGPGEKP